MTEKQKVTPLIRVITDEDVVRAETEKIERTRAELLGAALRAEQEGSATRQPARTILDESFARLLAEDDAARAAAETLRSLATDADKKPDWPSGRGSGGRAYDFQPPPSVDSESAIVTPGAYDYWQWGPLFASSFDDAGANQYARLIRSVAGSPRNATGAFGFQFFIEAESYTWADVKPIMNYEYSYFLIGPESWAGDGTAWFEWHIEMIVWRDGQVIVSMEAPVSNGYISGSPNMEGGDDGQPAWPMTLGFVMEPHIPYAVTIGAWAKCSSDCSPIGLCGQVYLDMYIYLPLVFVVPSVYVP